MRNYGILLPIALVSAALFAGCASVGNNFDEGKVSQIKKGETTEAELLEMFHEPQHRTLNSEGQTILTWMYSESSVKGESFIPYAGPFVGGTRSKSKSLSVTLQDGKVQSLAMTGGGMESRHTTQDVQSK
jgi:hypothetical protein